MIVNSFSFDTIAVGVTICLVLVDPEDAIDAIGTRPLFG